MKIKQIKFSNTFLIKILLVILISSILSITIVSASDTSDLSSNNILLTIQKSNHIIDEPVVISVVGAPLLDTSIYLDIYLLEDSYYSFRYLGIINDDIIFIPQRSGTYILKLFSIKDGQSILLSQNQFLVSDNLVSDNLVSDKLPVVQDIVQDDANIISDYANASVIGKQTNISSRISLVKHGKFGGATTNFEKYSNNLSLLKKLSNVTVEHPGIGRIQWHGALNVLNADIDANIQIIPESIVVNSEILDTSFNSSATLTMYDVPYTSPVILKNNKLCLNCQILSYMDGVLEFDVKGFSNYTLVENTSLMIWDNNDIGSGLYNSNLTRYVGQDIIFYANYTNQSDNSSIIDADCLINFSDNPTQSFSMIYDGELGVYTYMRNFTANDTYQYNITCTKINFYTLNLTNYISVDLAGDLSVSPDEVVFSQQYPVENESIIVYATIHSLIDYNFTDLLVRFYDGNPEINSTVIGDVYLNMTGISDTVVNVTWLSKVGLHNIYVSIDPLHSINDLNGLNNEAYNYTFTSLWQTYYGKMMPSTTNLGSANSTFINWSLSSTAPVNIYVTSAGSNINWMSLEALTRNITGGQDANSLNDFDDVDLSLGIENFTDSVNNTYSIGGYPINTSNYSVYHVLVRDVPETMSTNNTNFYTGLLWDTSDTVLPYYSYESVPSSRSDLLFVTKVNHNQLGAYGTYDYEIKVPAFLREYKGEGGVVQFYYEIQ